MGRYRLRLLRSPDRIFLAVNQSDPATSITAETLMKTALLRQFLPCLVALVAVAGSVVPASAETATSQLLVNQWIRQAEDGSIQGKIVLRQSDGTALAVSPAVVALADAKGEARSEKADKNGEFKFADVEPGVYTVLTRGAKDVCAIVALHVIAHDDEKAAGLASAIEVSAGRVDFSAVNANLIRYLPPRQFGENVVSVDNVDVNAISSTVAGTAFHRVKQTNGGMVGQIYAAGTVGNTLSPSREANVFLFQDGIEMERMTTDTNGRFEVAVLEPGVYSMMVVGNSGSGLVGFELVGEASKSFAAASNSNETLVTAMQEGVASQFVLQLAPSDGIVGNFQEMGVIQGEVISDVLIDEQVIGEEVIDEGFGTPMGGGGGGFGGGGGGFGGGGGGFGGGGAGGLLGLAGVGGAIAAIVAASDSDNDRVIVPPPATNAIP